MSLRRRVLGAEELPDASLSVIATGYNSEVTFPQLEDGTYIIHRGQSHLPGSSYSICFKVIITSPVSNYSWTLQLTDVFCRLDALDGVGTSGAFPTGTVFNGDGQFPYYGPYTGAGLILGNAYLTDATNIESTVAFTLSLDGYEDQSITVKIAVIDYFTVIEETREYAIYDASFNKTGWTADTSHPTVNTTLHNNMYSSSSYYSNLSYYSDEIAHLWTGPEVPSDWMSVNTWWPKPSVPICLKKTRYDTSTSFGTIYPENLTMNINGLVAYKLRTTCPGLKITESTSSIRNFIRYSSIAFNTVYEVAGASASLVYLAVDGRAYDQDRYYWIVFKIARVNSNKTLTFNIQGLDDSANVISSINLCNVSLVSKLALKLQVAMHMYPSPPGYATNYYLNKYMGQSGYFNLFLSSNSNADLSGTITNLPLAKLVGIASSVASYGGFDRCSFETPGIDDHTNLVRIIENPDSIDGDEWTWAMVAVCLANYQSNPTLYIKLEHNADVIDSNSPSMTFVTATTANNATLSPSYLSGSPANGDFHIVCSTTKKWLYNTASNTNYAMVVYNPQTYVVNFAIGLF